MKNWTLILASLAPSLGFAGEPDHFNKFFAPSRDFSADIDSEIEKANSPNAPVLKDLPK